MSIFEFSCDEDTGSGDHVSFGSDSFGGLPLASSDIPDMPAGLTQPQKRLWLARYYRQIMSGQRPPPPPPRKRPAAPTSSSSGGGSRNVSGPNLAQIVSTAKQVPGMVNAAQSGLSALSNLASGLSNGDVDPNVSADVSINGEFFDDELTWPGHRHYTYMWPYKTSPLGAQDPFTNAEFGADMEVSVLDPHDGRTYRGKLSAEDDGMGFDETFMSASNQLPALIFGAEMAQASWSDGSASPHAAAMTAALDASTVRQVQSRLNTLGYGPLATDGILGPKTLRALGKFQMAASLPTSGLDAASLNALIGYVPGM